MDQWAARDLLMERDPSRALRAHAVDPLPPRPKPCECADEDKIEVADLGKPKPDLICGGFCR